MEAVMLYYVEFINGNIDEPYAATFIRTELQDSRLSMGTVRQMAMNKVSPKMDSRTEIHLFEINEDGQVLVGKAHRWISGKPGRWASITLIVNNEDVARSYLAF